MIWKIVFFLRFKDSFNLQHTFRSTFCIHSPFYVHLFLCPPGIHQQKSPVNIALVDSHLFVKLQHPAFFASAKIHMLKIAPSRTERLLLLHKLNWYLYSHVLLYLSGVLFSWDRYMKSYIPLSLICCIQRLTKINSIFMYNWLESSLQ